MDSLLQAVNQFGLPVALAVFFVWRSDVRETRMAKEIAKKDAFIAEKFLEQEQEQKKLLRENTLSNQAVADALKNVITAVNNNRCRASEETNSHYRS